VQIRKVNPFQPNSPVHPGMFVGRIEEVIKLESILLQLCKGGKPVNFIITGERGIGKTSLLKFLTWEAQGDIPVEKEKLSFLVVFTDISSSTSQIDLVKKIELGLREKLHQDKDVAEICKEIGDFITRFESDIIRYNKKDNLTSDEVYLEEYSYKLARLVEKLCGGSGKKGKYDGLLLLIDEADNSTKELKLGSFFKLFLERLQRQNCEKIIIGLAGLPDLLSILKESHPSSPRLFEPIKLNRLSTEEVNRVVDGCLEDAKKKNDHEISITKGALNWLVRFSEGFPHFIQQYGYSAFAYDKDWIIDEKDVTRSAMESGGAMEIIGDHYYKDAFYNQIRGENCREVLRIMADDLDGWVSRKKILQQYKGKPATLDSALRILRERKIIIPKLGSRGMYRLEHKGFALWILYYTTPPKRLKNNNKGK